MNRILLKLFHRCIFKERKVKKLKRSYIINKSVEEKMSNSRGRIKGKRVTKWRSFF